MPYVKNPCEHCGGNIEADSEYLGRRLVCPHCGIATVFGSLPVQVVPVAVPPVVPPMVRPQVVIVQAPQQTPYETKGRSSARWVKGLSTLTLLVSIPGCIFCSQSKGFSAAFAVWSVLGIAAFVGFIIGRFME